jgi:hypothetical protein
MLWELLKTQQQEHQCIKNVVSNATSHLAGINLQLKAINKQMLKACCLAVHHDMQIINPKIKSW